MRYKKLRLWATYPFAGLYIIIAYKNGLELFPGIWFVLSGLIIRCWAAGYIKKIRVLTTAGPYAFVRNPLYVGNFLLGLGFCLFVKDLLFMVLYIILFKYFYFRTMKEEEELLTALFKEEYIKYKEVVPAIIPRILPYAYKNTMRYSFKQAYYNGEVIRIIITGILLSLVYFAVRLNDQDWIDKSGAIKFSVVILLQGVILVIAIKHRKDFVKRNRSADAFKL